MKRLLYTGLAALSLCLFLAPQAAQAAPSLDWHGKDQITYQAPQSAFGFDVMKQSMNHGSSKEARNAGRALSGGAQLGIGIPITILGVSLTVPAFYLLTLAAAADAAGAEGGGAIIFGIPSIILFSLGIPAIVAGINLIVGGVKALSKIEAKRIERRQNRYAMKSQHNARWGMKVSFAGVPLNR